jgi:single-stranded DNA-specific DHH superfamily exonuclease
MLTQKEIEEIKDHLEKAQNPLFYFDNDQDGLSSYLLFRRFIERGNGIPIKSSPLGLESYRRVDEFKPDYIFILDQPTVSKEFFEKLRETNLPVVWIDHHENNLSEIPEWVNYFNPLYNETKSNEPVTALAYQVTQRKKDLWIAVLGCIADKYFPPFYSDFLIEYPDLGLESNDAFDIFYGASIGKIARIVGSGLKDRTTLVMKMVRFLIKAKTPYEVLEEKIENNFFHKRFNLIDAKLKKFFNKAKEEYNGKGFLFFKYAGETSMSADIANRLSHEFEGIVVVVAFVKGVRVNLSIRGRGIREKVLELIKEFPFATGGGHEDAVGAQIDIDQLEEFREKLEKLVIK